jgi:hypothetical protein
MFAARTIVRRLADFRRLNTSLTGQCYLSFTGDAAGSSAWQVLIVSAASGDDKTH